MGKYTCYSSTECTDLYKIIGVQTTNRPGYFYQALVLINEVDYYSSSSYGTVITSTMAYNQTESTLANYGYMYGDNLHLTDSLHIESPEIVFDDSLYLYHVDSRSNYTNGYVADSFRYAYGFPEGGSSSSYYTRENIYLDNPVPTSSLNNLSEMIGKYYAPFIDDNDYSTYRLKYIVDVDNTNVYYIEYSHHDQHEFVPYTSIYFGTSITANDDGTFTINDGSSVTAHEINSNPQIYTNMIICFNGAQTCDRPVRLTEVDSWTYFLSVYYTAVNRDILVAKSRNGYELNDTRIVSIDDYVANFDDYNREYKYTCGNLSSTCTEDNLSIITGKSTYYSSSSNYGYTRLFTIQNDFYFGSDVTWDGEKYTLVDPLEFEAALDLDVLSTHHYTCLGGKLKKSCEEVYYLLSSNDASNSSSRNSSGFSVDFMVLKNGENDVQKIYDDMTKKNIHDSLAKAVIEEWYERHLIKYTDYLEDSVYCNDRKQLKDDNSIASKTGNLRNAYKPRGLTARAYEDYLSGYNAYPEGFYLTLKCEQETDRFSVDNPKAKLKYPVGLITYDEMAIMNNRNARSLSSSTYSMTGFTVLMSSGEVRNSSSYPISPAITLKPGTIYIDGDGSRDNPYVVDTSEVDNQ